MSYISLSCPIFFVVSNTLFITVVVKSEKEHPDLLVRELLLIQSICSSSYIGNENVYFITQKACSCKLHNNRALASSYYSSSSILSAYKYNCLDKEGKTPMRWFLWYCWGKCLSFKFYNLISRPYYFATFKLQPQYKS